MYIVEINTTTKKHLEYNKDVPLNKGKKERYVSEMYSAIDVNGDQKTKTENGHIAAVLRTTWNL